MGEAEPVARYCKQCGRSLEGTERMTGVCVRCRTLGNRDGALDVQQAFEGALDGFLAKKGTLAGSRLGTWGIVLTLFLVGWVGVLWLCTRDAGRAVQWATTALAPVEMLALCSGVVALADGGTRRVFAGLTIVMNGAGLWLFGTRLAAVLSKLEAGGASAGAVIVELFR